MRQKNTRKRLTTDIIAVIVLGIMELLLVATSMVSIALITTDMQKSVNFYMNLLLFLICSFLNFKTLQIAWKNLKKSWRHRNDHK